MRKLEEIEDQIRNLSGNELAAFRKWYAEFDAQAGKLDALAEAARKAHKEGKSTEF